VVTAAPRRPATKVPLPPAEVVADPLEEELRTLRRVERSLRAGNPQLALALLRDLDSKVPAGKLIEERRAALAVATCTTNPGSRSAHLQGFADQFPGSVYAARVRASCADELPEDAIGPTDHHLSRDSAE
jgi:hypothetical protein